MILIIESGATKTDWRGILSSGEVVGISTGGMNLSTMSEEHIEEALEQAMPCFRGETVEDIHVYAAGLLKGASPLLEKRLSSAFPGASAEYCSDLTAAARSLHGRKEGIACILGTGSNNCQWDGKAIVRNVRSAGFILGDEGGAACLGRLFISDFLKEIVPEEVAGDFVSQFDASYPSIVQGVYKSGMGAAYLGSFAPFILSWYPRNEYIKSLVDRNFRDFIERCLLRYDYSRIPVGIVGGFGFACRDILLPIAREYGIEISSIVPSPLEGLVKYHSPASDQAQMV